MGSLKSSCSSKGKQCAIKKRSRQSIKPMLEQIREVKVVIFLEKACNPLAGILDRLERLSDVSVLNGKLEIWQRSLLGLPMKEERSREVRLLNLWKRRWREGRVG